MSYGQQLYSREGYAIQAAESERATFLRRTYLHLFGAILAFMGIEAAVFATWTPQQVYTALWGGRGMGMLIVFIGFMIASWVARAWAHSRASSTLQYMGLGMYTVAEAIFFAPLLALAVQMDQGGTNIITTAGTITLLVFGGLTVIVLASGANFSFLRIGLMVGSWAALITMIVAMFTGFSLGIFFVGALAILACGFILYDTSNVLHHYRTDQHVGAALELFASVALLFWYVLQIVMELQRQRD